MSQNQDQNQGTDSVENTGVKSSKVKQRMPKKRTEERSSACWCYYWYWQDSIG